MIAKSLAAAFILTLLSNQHVDAAARKCPVFDCLPHLLSTDITKVTELFNYESIIGITRTDDSGIEDREKAIHDVCTSYLRFDNCFGGEWWECFDIAELLNVAKDAFSYLKLPGGGDLSQLTEDQVTVGLKVASYACRNWDFAMNNSYCIRSSMVRNNTLYRYFVEAGFDMSSRPETITCERFRSLFHLFVYGLSTNCNEDLANATNTLLIMGMQAIPSFNLSSCHFMTFDEIQAKKPDLSILANYTHINDTFENEIPQAVTRVQTKQPASSSTTVRLTTPTTGPSARTASPLNTQSTTTTTKTTTTTAKPVATTLVPTTSTTTATTTRTTASSTTSRTTRRLAESTTTTTTTAESSSTTVVDLGFDEVGDETTRRTTTRRSQPVSDETTTIETASAQQMRHKPKNGAGELLKLSPIVFLLVVLQCFFG